MLVSENERTKIEDILYLRQLLNDIIDSEIIGMSKNYANKNKSFINEMKAAIDNCLEFTPETKEE